MEGDEGGGEREQRKREKATWFNSYQVNSIHNYYQVLFMRFSRLFFFFFVFFFFFFFFFSFDAYETE